MSDDTPDPHVAQQHLIAGLVDGHGDLYRNSPFFHAQITALANLLPLWVNGIAEQAKSSDRMILSDEIMHSHFTTLLANPACLCHHLKSNHFEGDKPGCLSCQMPHPFEPRWALVQCETWVSENVARKTGFPMSPTGSRCLKEKGHDPIINQHVAVDGDQWVAWT